MVVNAVDTSFLFIAIGLHVPSIMRRPRVAGELKVYLDRGSLSTWVTKYGVLHKTQLAYFDNEASLAKKKTGAVFLLKQATTVSMVRGSRQFALLCMSLESRPCVAGTRGEVSSTQCTFTVLDICRLLIIILTPR